MIFTIKILKNYFYYKNALFLYKNALGVFTIKFPRPLFFFLQ